MKATFPRLVSVLLVAACGTSESPTTPTVDQPVLRAVEFTDNVVFPLDLFVFVPCAAGGAGEYVHLTGNLHSLFHVAVSNSGNFTLKEHFQPQGVSGSGQGTGANYRATGVTQDVLRFGQVGQTYTFINNFRIIGPGPGNNFLMHETFHITVNANGTLTSFVAGFKANCK